MLSGVYFLLEHKISSLESYNPDSSVSGAPCGRCVSYTCVVRSCSIKNTKVVAASGCAAICLVRSMRSLLSRVSVPTDTSPAARAASASDALVVFISAVLLVTAAIIYICLCFLELWAVKMTSVCRARRKAHVALVLELVSSHVGVLPRVNTSFHQFG